MSDTQTLHEFVLEAIADDYESLECVIAHVTPWGAALDRKYTREEIVEALRWAIREGYAQAFLLSARPPHATQVVFSHDRLSELWFYVTPLGKQLVKKLGEDQVT